MELWSELQGVLEKECKWLLAGDLNFVEKTIGKSSFCGKIISTWERQVFEELLRTLNVEECFPNMGPIKYTWDNKRLDGVRILARLDRI